MRVALLPLVLLTGCATTLLEQDIRRQSDGWTVTFHKLEDGPDSFATTFGGGFRPAPGQRFLWVTLGVRNDARVARKFSFDSCALYAYANTYLPVYVGLNIGHGADVTKQPVLAGGEEITRKLAFGYPKYMFPDRLVCFGNEFPFGRK